MFSYSVADLWGVCILLSMIGWGGAVASSIEREPIGVRAAVSASLSVPAWVAF
jgi:hypothetical protein